MAAVARDGAVFVKVNQRPVMPTATIYKRWAVTPSLPLPFNKQELKSFQQYAFHQGRHCPFALSHNYQSLPI
jgi:hypothetical protein